MPHLSRIALTLLLTASLAWAGATLDVVETAGDYYTVTAVDVDDPAVLYWRLKVDIASGCIFSFEDLGDDGDGAGGHTSYLSTDGYSRKCSLLQFYGRGNQVMTRSAANLADLTAHLTFATAGDGSAFTITYAEDATSAAWFQNAYGSDAVALTPGDMQTTITVTIRPPTELGTFWDWSISQLNVSDHAIDGRVWAKQEVRSNIHGGIPFMIDNESTPTNGVWNPTTPVSFARFTIDDNSLGLTTGREFILDYVSDLTIGSGSTASSGSWAGFTYLIYKAPYALPSAGNLLPGATRVDEGQFIMNIASDVDPNAPTAEAGTDQVVSDDDGTGAEDIVLDGSASTDPNGTIVSYSWSIDGTEIATGVNPTVSLAIGQYEIKLTVVDNDGSSDTDKVTVTVSDPNYNEPPIADAGADQNISDADRNGSQDVTLDGTGSTDTDGTIASYVWTRNSVEIATGATAVVTLNQGTYTVMLTVTDNGGETASDTVTITVYDPNPELLVLPQPDPNCGLPESLPIDTESNQLLNTYGQNISGTRPTDLIWPANAGEAHLCEYLGDKFAAASITIDDMNRPDHDWWIQQTQLHDFKVTWFIIPSKLADYPNSSSAVTLYGYWSTFENLFNLGHDVQSHSMTHTDNQHLDTTCELHYEYGVSQDLINQYIPGNQCLTMAYPWGEGRATVASQYYIAVRGTSGGANIPYQTTYIGTKCASTSVRPVTDIILTGSGDLSWSNSIYKRGWAVFLFHGVGDYAGTAANLAYMMSFRDQIWIEKFDTVAKYGQQRDTATLTVTSADESQIALTLTDRMMDSIFNIPMTVKVKLYDGWDEVSATQDGQAVPASIVTHDNAKYALVDIVPDAGDVLITPGAPAKPGDANLDGKVDLSDFVLLKTNFGAGPNATWGQGDFDGNGTVNLNDFVILKTNFGS